MKHNIKIMGSEIGMAIAQYVFISIIIVVNIQVPEYRIIWEGLLICFIVIIGYTNYIEKTKYEELRIQQKKS